MSLSGRLPTQVARCARTIIPARTARLLSSHGRSKRGLEGTSNSATVRAQHGRCDVGDMVSRPRIWRGTERAWGSTQPQDPKDLMSAGHR
jgi:hypothetical protein